MVEEKVLGDFWLHPSLHHSDGSMNHLSSFVPFEGYLLPLLQKEALCV